MTFVSQEIKDVCVTRIAGGHQHAGGTWGYAERRLRAAFGCVQ